MRKRILAVTLSIVALCAATDPAVEGAADALGAMCQMDFEP